MAVEVREVKRKKGTAEKDKLVVFEDRRSITSRGNAKIKNLKYAKLPVYCNDCYYRSEEAGGNGKCSAYKEDALCEIRSDIKKHCLAMDSRKPDDLKSMVDEMIQLLRERTMFAMFTAGMDGNTVDKGTNAQLNTLHSYIKLMRELQGTTTVTATEARTESDFITDLFRQVKVERTGQE